MQSASYRTCCERIAFSWANPPVDAAIEAPDAAVGAAPLSKAVVVPPAEVFARSRLLLLQTSVDNTVEALRNREQTNP